MNSDFHCKSCDSDRGLKILDLGRQPLANNLLPEGGTFYPEPFFPLSLAVCLDCYLMQLLDIIPPVKMFSEYLYFSSFSDALLKHSKAAVESHIKEFSLCEDSLVVEIASNDGYLLQYFVENNIPALGIEPAENIAVEARKKGIETIVEFFTCSLADSLASSGKKTDLILGNNVFAHVPDTNDFVAGLAVLLKKGGRVVLEFPWGHEMIQKLEFDTIYHEHVFYFSLTPLIPLFERHGLEIFHVERLPIHGGSLRLYAGHKGYQPVRETVALMLSKEEEEGIKTLGYYEKFQDGVESLRQELLSLLGGLKKEGESIAAYGASAKGSTLLNYCGIGVSTIDFIVDRSTYKQGLLSPGMHIPILPPEALIERQPDYALLLTWNFAEEILRQQAPYTSKGGKFIVPVPKPTVV